ncbi:MAG: hypothetical protein KGQ59_03625, partial [Bdellovibrionales bacterium]|nr:hypothetical protein [Bdellovibrionales bacterium]
MGQPQHWAQTFLRSLISTAAIAALSLLSIQNTGFWVLADDEEAVTQPHQPSDRDRLAEIQTAYSKAQYPKVLELAQSFERDFHSSSKLPEVLNLKGLALLLTKKPDAAANAFSSALQRAPDALLGDRNWKNYVRYNFSAALLEAGNPSDSEKEL